MSIWRDHEESNAQARRSRRQRPVLRAVHCGSSRRPRTNPCPGGRSKCWRGCCSSGARSRSRSAICSSSHTSPPGIRAAARSSPACSWRPARDSRSSASVSRCAPSCGRTARVCQRRISSSGCWRAPHPRDRGVLRGEPVTVARLRRACLRLLRRSRAGPVVPAAALDASSRDGWPSSGSPATRRSCSARRAPRSASPTSTPGPACCSSPPVACSSSSSRYLLIFKGLEPVGSNLDPAKARSAAEVVA